MSILEDLRNALDDRMRCSGSKISSPVFDAGILPGITDAFSQVTDGIRKSGELRKRTCLHESISQNLFGTIVLRSKTERRSVSVEGFCIEDYETVLSIIFQPASWLFKIGLGAGFEIARIYSQKGWQCRISSIRAVPDDSLIFQFCDEGYLEGVRGLFKGGKASVQDVDSRGLTPLHVRILGYFILPPIPRNAPF